MWVQGKGLSNPAYAKLTRRSSDLWPEFAELLKNQSGIDIAYQRTGGLEIYLTEDELSAGYDELKTFCRQSYPGSNGAEILHTKQLRELVPAVSEKAHGACYCPLDGAVNPLLLLRALHTSFINHDGKKVCQARVKQIQFDRHFQLETTAGRFSCERLVLAAGLGNQNLAPKVGLIAPVEPVRGQILVTARLPKFLNFPTLLVRQTEDGTVLLGDTHEKVGYNRRTTASAAGAIAARACKTFPLLEKAQLLRQWSALRVMPPNGYPVYQQSEQCSGASAVSCHSGVTLAAAHMVDLAPALARGSLNELFRSFGNKPLDRAA